MSASSQGIERVFKSTVETRMQLRNIRLRYAARGTRPGACQWVLLQQDISVCNCLMRPCNVSQ